MRADSVPGGAGRLGCSGGSDSFTAGIRIGRADRYRVPPFVRILGFQEQIETRVIDSGLNPIARSRNKIALNQFEVTRVGICAEDLGSRE